MMIRERLTAHGLIVRRGGRILVDVDTLSLEPGQVAALVGPNGAGKSTFLATLAGVGPADDGAVALGDRRLLHLPADERARRIGYLPQTPEIAWRLSVEAYVRLGRIPRRGVLGFGAKDHEAVERTLERTGVGLLSERDITTLSGGERARVLIARALAGEPDWLIADEPLTGLDLGHQLDAGALLRAAAQSGLGVIVAVHDLGFAARFADRVVVMAEGRVLADGSPSEALGPQRLQRAYGVQARWTPGEGGPLLDIIGRTR
jgi:iron complex transport system ATP-binding protein